MALIKKLKAFLLFDWKTKSLLLESYLYLGWSRYLKSVPFSKVAPTLGNHMEETSFTLSSSNKEVLASVAQAIHIMSRYTFWESQCLVKAIAAMKMLEKRQIESTLYLGTAREENGELVAHAWLRSGPFYITGAEVMERFTVVSKFAKKL
ncbi:MULTISPECIES: lasso peptide biosynthesis B2 protein [Priestia]|uniref:Lasso peptide biosynthesis B2 protein n=1 Tax=Priestia aryabhattai TaxID=412384 RepID=A0ABD5KST7_PRIAR|nr:MULTISPECIES: lasso peptide biosynthesis B2 protein [Priestia]MBK0292127.1 lasso peptide biosynthesis B2 protein [Bacillus sp. S34]UPK48063.1 lasso peptide biosynthesis B2 protein [Bacillus sp. H8-1]MDC7764060.1 lasso peptide biosynthesis B2 protein [Priestia aryabhattai]MEB4885988.1 lasso peptide biosynthesis B2 protein [Priestia megaterium]MED3951905.1 lasso peptide biosynthesis B2 protein [Priestia aryabhattai]